MDLYQELFSLTAALNEVGIPYTICGGLAVALHGYPRFTQDIDLLILPEDELRTLSAAEGLGFVIKAGRLPIGVGEPIEREIVRVSKVVDREIVTLDLLIVNATIQSAWDSRMDLDLRGHRVSAVSRDGLKLLKILGGRRQDLLDLEQLGMLDEDAI